MKRTYQCLSCNARVEIVFIEKKTQQRVFLDEKVYTQRGDAKYLWGNGHNCPLLQGNTLDYYKNLLKENKIIEVKKV